MQEFLSCKPTVFVIGEEYEIVLHLNAYGICFLKIGDKLYYEDNAGVLPSERTALKIRVPQSALDAAKEYEVIFRETEERKRYWSVFFPPVSQKFAFQPLEKTDDIRIYYLSDVHGNFDNAPPPTGGSRPTFLYSTAIWPSRWPSRIIGASCALWAR